MKQETFIKQTNVNAQNSFGIIASEKDCQLEFTIRIHDGEKTGSFELADVKTGGNKWYAEGGLWFDEKELVDYDGVFELPEEILDKLEEWGFNVEYIR